jgi:hypothetical protein
LFGVIVDVKDRVVVVEEGVGGGGRREGVLWKK